MKTPFPSAPKKNNHIVLMVFLALSLAWHCFGADAARAQQPADSPRSEKGDILLSGKLACSLKRHVIMPFLAIITELPVQAGQKVTAGETLARYRLLPESVAKIRSRLFPTQIKDLEMAQVKLAAKLSELEKHQEALQQLARDNLTSQQSLDQVENEIKTICKERNATSDRLKWARQLHQDDLAVLQKQLGLPSGPQNLPAEGRLSAPLGGYVIWVHPDMRVGAEFKPEEPAFLIGNLDTMIIKAQVHELEAMRLKLGDQAEVQVASLPGKKFSARVSRVSWSSITSAPDQPSFFEVEFSVPNPEHILKDGLKVQIIVPKAPDS